jgi:hypothetical protein
MYRRTHRALAKAIREAGAAQNLTETQVAAMAEAIADVCEEHTPKSAAFDREVFIALANQRQMTLGE